MNQSLDDLSHCIHLRMFSPSLPSIITTYFHPRLLLFCCYCAMEGSGGPYFVLPSKSTTQSFPRRFGLQLDTAVCIHDATNLLHCSKWQHVVKRTASASQAGLLLFKSCLVTKAKRKKPRPELQDQTLLLTHTERHADAGWILMSCPTWLDCLLTYWQVVVFSIPS